MRENITVSLLRTYGALSGLAANTALKALKRLWRSDIPIGFIIGVLITTLAASPQRFTEGKAYQVENGLYALVVSSGYRSPLHSAAVWVNSARESSPRNPYDMVESSANSDAAALDFLSTRPAAGLLIEPLEESGSWYQGFRNGDIVTSIRFVGLSANRECVKSTSTGTDLSAAWGHIAKCDAKVNLLRDNLPRSLNVKAGSLDGVLTRTIGSHHPSTTPSNLKGVDGTSAGLALAMHHVNRRTEGDLFAGTTIAATGTISPTSSTIGPIKGLKYKAEAAAAAGVRILFVPAGQEREVPSYLGMRVLPVSNLEDAIRHLCLLGARDDACAKLSN
jgi:hypothetical protein